MMQKTMFFPLLFPALFFAAAMPSNLFLRPMAANEKALYAVGRLSYGPTPALLEEVRKVGLNRWIDQQLHPEQVKENPELVARLAELETLTMDTEELSLRYPAPAQLAALVRQGRIAELQDPLLRARVQRYLDSKNKANTAVGAKGDKQELKRQARQPLDFRAAMETLTAEQRQFLRGTPEERVAMLKALPAEQRDLVLAALPGPVRNQILLGDDAPLRRDLLAAISPNQVIYHDLAEGKILRATYSNRQLEEMLVDFWYNHFNVFIDKGADKVLVTSYERDAIRPPVLGKFSDLVTATAKHPAMLFYLDNWTSISADASEALAMRRRRAGTPDKPASKKVQGLNENYARELLELHTMGVDGGYTQQDVQEVARCFTGWSITNARQGGEFIFRPRVHDRAAKIVLGTKIAAGGDSSDGMKVIEIVSNHPSTAKFISFKLAQRFVADAPPASIVQAMAATFTKTGGDLREVMRTMLGAKEFWSQGARDAKIKMPFESMISALRATGAKVESSRALVQNLQELGQPLYKKVEPTGYYVTAEEWTSSAALLARMNFGLALARNEVKGVKVGLDKKLDGQTTPVAIATALLFRPPTPSLRAALEREENPSPARLAGLVLGGPDFQRR